MSWSVYKTGTKDKVRAACEAEFDRCAKMYEGKEEERDVRAAKECALSAIDELDMSSTAYDPPGSTYGVDVKANGSRGSYSTTIAVNVTRVQLLI